MEKKKRIAGIIFNIIFFVTLSVIFVCVSFDDFIHKYQTGKLMVYMFVGLIVMIASYIFFEKKKLFFEKYYHICLAFYFVLYVAVVAWLGYKLRFKLSFDLFAVFDGARDWMETGDFSKHYEYFGYFPHNMGMMAILRVLFGVANIFGVKDFYAFAIIINSVIIGLTAVIVSLIVKRISGIAVAMTSLIMYIMCIPFFFMSAIIYTDSFSMIFPVLFIWLYLIFLEHKSIKIDIFCVACMGVSMTVGMMIKFTVLIAMLAVFLDALLRMKIKCFMLFAGVCTIIVTVNLKSFDTYMHKNFLNEKEYVELSTPYSHWIMMGLYNNGSYSTKAYEYTRSFNYRERNAACVKRIEERLKELGVTGLFEQMEKKLLVCFGDGTFALSDMLEKWPVKHSKIHEYILYDGEYFEELNHMPDQLRNMASESVVSEKYTFYKTVTTGMLLALYLLALIGSLGEVIYSGNEKKESYYLVVRMAVMGMVCFLLLWETSGRYIINFVPVILLCAVSGIEMLRKLYDQGGKIIKKGENEIV